MLVAGLILQGQDPRQPLWGECDEVLGFRLLARYAALSDVRGMTAAQKAAATPRE